MNLGAYQISEQPRLRSVFGIDLRDFTKIGSSRQTLPGNWPNSLLYNLT